MRFHDARDDREAEAVAFCFRRREQRREGARALLVGHAHAGVAELDADVRGRGAVARELERAGGDREAAAVGHRLDGVEREVQEDLLELRGVGHDRGQVGLKAANELDVVVGQFVAHEQREVVEQFVRIDGAELRFRAAREVEDLLHDAVQPVHFFADDLAVLHARIARWELQVHRVIQHLHHRERIANLVRDLGGEQSQRG